jgi:hypothetical protein
MSKIDNNYVCPRCNYSTPLKKCIKRHLYDKKTPCPDNNNLALTEEIKEFVMINKKYHPPKNSKKSLIQNITNYNTLNAIVSGMDLVEKLNKVLNYSNSRTLDFDDKVENRFLKQVDRLEKDHYKYGYEINQEDIMEHIYDLTRINGNDLEQLNVLMDLDNNRLNIFRNPKWESYFLDQGIANVVRTLKSNYLDIYEKYLIKKIYTTHDANIAVRYQQQIEAYYTFLAHFDLEPSCKFASDAEILDNSSADSYSVSDKYTKLYGEIKGRLNRTDSNQIKRQIKDIIKRTTLQNKRELDRKILDLINLDEAFKELFFPDKMAIGK